MMTCFSSRFSRRPLVAALMLAFSAPLLATELETVVVEATRIPYADTAATYASEVHSRKMIERSGAASLIDYLAQQTSVQVMPSYGNSLTPLLDMRGYGIENGHQNIALLVDGQRLNAIDLSAPLLGTIPLENIERVEITKGSGSVIYGDSAMAGVIHIYTRPPEGIALSSSVGNYGARTHHLNAALTQENFSLAVNGEQNVRDGYSKPDATGHKDSSEMNAQNMRVRVRPFQKLWLSVEGGHSDVDTRYIGPLTLAQFKADPTQSGGNTYTYQQFKSDRWKAGAVYDITERLQLNVNHLEEDKISSYITSGWRSSYENRHNDLGLVYQGESTDISAGLQTVAGTRIGATNRTSKDSTAHYVNGVHRLGDLSISAGLRQEQVAYRYKPNSGTTLSDTRNLEAWDVGVNCRLNPQYSVFANYNKAFQAPDIDRFFNWGGTFNGFIVPAVARTITLGVNRVSPGNRFKLALYRANLQNEIYYDPLTWQNTNIDRSHKKGMELQQFWQALPELAFNANYTYTQAIIDQKDGNGGAYNGKTLPGVPRHTVALALNYALTAQTSLNLSHHWRSESYAFNDFSNAARQRQEAQEMTNLVLRYRRNQLEVYAAVDNLFGRKNGVWTGDNVIYPVNYTQNYRLGLKLNFF